MRPGARELRLRLMILEKYPSLREFSRRADIPYSTLMTVLERGIAGAGFDLMMKICRELGVEAERVGEYTDL